MSTCSRSQRGRTLRKEGGKGCLYWGKLYVNYLTSLSSSLSSLVLSLFGSVVVFPPGSMGKHGAVDGLLCGLLGHLAHHPHCPRHAGPGKLLSINICQSFQLQRLTGVKIAPRSQSLFCKLYHPPPTLPLGC